MHIITRRQFLLGSGAISILTAAHLLPQIDSYPTHQIPVHALSDRTVHIYRILGNWLIPEGGGIPGSGGDDITIQRIDALHRHLPEGQQFLLSALPLVFEHGTALNRFASKRMTSLSPKERDTYLSSWMTTTELIPAQLVAALRTMFAMTYFERIDVQQAINTPPSCVPQ